MSTLPLETLLTVKQVAGLLNVSKSKVYFLVNSQQIKSIPIGDRGVRFAPSDVQAYLDEQRDKQARIYHVE